MSRQRLRIAGAFSTAALLIAGCTSREPRRAPFHPLEVGSAVPRYSAITISGDTVNVGGGKGPVMLVNVWATWCESCREEMAALDSLHRSFGPRGVRVLGVSVDEGTGERVRRFVASNGLKFTIAHDPAGEIERRFGVMGVPTTFVVSSDGRLRWRHTGNIAGMVRELGAVVDSARKGGE